MLGATAPAYAGLYPSFSQCQPEHGSPAQPQPGTSRSSVKLPLLRRRGNAGGDHPPRRGRCDAASSSIHHTLMHH